MIELIATPQNEDTGVHLDIDTKVTVQLSLSVQDIRNFSNRRGGFTQSFSLPWTVNNNQFFEMWFDVETSTNYFNAYKKVSAEILVDTIPQFKGYLKLNSVKKNARVYEVTMFSEISELAKEIGDKTLRQLDEDWLQGYDHLFTLQNIVDSWSESLVTPNGNGSDIQYPYVNYGNGHTFGDGSQNDVTQNGFVQDYEFRPWMKIKPIFDQIMKEAGFIVESDFMTTERWEKVFMSLANTKEGAKALTFPYNLLISLFSDQTLTITSGEDPIINTVTTQLFFVDDNVITSVPGLNTATYDSGNIWNNANYEMTVPRSGSWSFEVNIQYEIEEPVYATTDIFAAFRVKRNGSYITDVNGFPKRIDSVPQFSNGIGNPHFVQGVFNLTASINDTLEFEFALGAKDNQGGIDYRINILQDKSYVQIVDQPKNGINDVIGIRRNMPDMKQIDFIRGLSKTFNLFVEPDPIEPKKLYIEPYPDYIDNGELKDWTNKLDTSKEVTIKPTHQYRKKRFKLQYTSDEYYLAQWAKENRGRPLNSYEYIAQDEFAQGEEVNEVPFGVMAWHTPYDMTQHKLTTYGIYGNDDGVIEPVDFTPTLGYICQQFGQMVGINIADNLNQTGLNYNFYSVVSNYNLSQQGNNVIDVNKFPVNGNGTNNDCWDLSFGVNSGYMPQNIAPSNLTSFNDFWSRYISEIYNKNARVMEAYFMLDVVDVHSLRLNSTIFVKDSYWRINKVSNHVIGGKKSTKVELIKIIDDFSLYSNCELSIASFEPQGWIYFSDGVSNDLTGNKECCEAYGYDWKESVSAGEGTELTSRCWWGDIPESEGGGSNHRPENPEQPTGACCFEDGSCQELEYLQCISQGGTYNGDGSDCQTTSCDQPEVTGACCIDGVCSDGIPQSECEANNGTFLPNQTCEEVTCE